MNVILFIVMLIVSFIVVRIGAVAFQLTGLEWSLAKFQALSCFTGTGFTTRESELITSSPQRRRIATYLIILGHAGLVALVATFANSLRPNLITDKIKLPFTHLVFPSKILPWANLVIIVIALYVVYRIFTSSGFAKKITNILRKVIVHKEVVKAVSFEELLVATGGYGILRLEVEQGNPLTDKTLGETGLRSEDISVIVLERGTDIHTNPRSDMKILLGDKLICFGKLENIRKKSHLKI